MESKNNATNSTNQPDTKKQLFSRCIDENNMLWIPIQSVNPHIICGLCQGYLYEACTITECMHSFCKNCIVKHLERSLNCPMCAILIHPTDPFVHIRLDGLLQDIVYALLPHVEKEELKRERAYYEKHNKQSDVPRRIHSTNVVQKAVITHPLTQTIAVPPRGGHIPPVALCLQCLEQGTSKRYLDKQFVRVTGRATIRNLALFLQKKLHIDDGQKVDIYCPCQSGFVYLNNSHTLKAVKDLYSNDKDILLLNYDISSL